MQSIIETVMLWHWQTWAWFTLAWFATGLIIGVLFGAIARVGMKDEEE